MSDNRISKRELASLLVVSVADAYREADKLGIPYSIRETVSEAGDPLERRVYLRTAVMAALDEWGRHSARQAAS